VKKLTKDQFRVFTRHFAEALREIGVLWFVFSMLDQLVNGRFTWLWALPKVAGALAAWAVGTYIDMREERTQ
jgi:hypothetical protein